MHDEIQAVETNHTWSIVPLPFGKIPNGFIKQKETPMAPLKDTKPG